MSSLLKRSYSENMRPKMLPSFLNCFLVLILCKFSVAVFTTNLIVHANTGLVNISSAAYTVSTASSELQCIIRCNNAAQSYWYPMCTVVQYQATSGLCVMASSCNFVLQLESTMQSKTYISRTFMSYITATDIGAKLKPRK